MLRNLSALLVLALAGIAMADEPLKALPQGTWQMSMPGNRGTWTMTLDGKGVKWVGRGQKDKGGIVTFIAPVCVLAADGKIAYGYTTRMSWVNGEESADQTGPNPFAFTFKVDGDDIKIADFKMTGIDESYFYWLSGTFTKVPPEETAQVPKEASTLER